MNKKVLKIAIGAGAVAGIAVPTVALVACGSSSAAAKTPTVSYANVPSYDYKGTAQTSKKFYSILSDPENPRWVQAKSDMTAAANEAKFSEVKVDILKSQESQNTALVTAGTGYDAYILGATENNGFASQIGTLNTSKANAPVIAYDRLMTTNSANYNWYVAFDSYKVGRLQGLSIINSLYGTDFTATSTTDADVTAKVTASKLKAKAGVMALAGDPADNNAMLFFNGAKSVIDAAVKADSNLVELGSWTFSEIAADKWDYDKGRTILQTAIGKLDKDQKASLKAVLAPNDGMANVVIPTLTASGLSPKDIWITGLDSNNTAIISIAQDGGQDMTVFKPDYTLARVAVALAIQLITKKASTADEVKTAISTAYPTITAASITVDTTTYMADAPKDSTTKKAINTVLLDPVMITKANYAKYFTVS